MSRNWSAPRANDGLEMTTRSWGIRDAGAFRVGKSDTIHAVHSFPTWHSVRGKCGVMGNTYDTDRYDRLAEWAAGAVDCETCRNA